MVQNIIALVIVFGALLITLWKGYSSLIAKKSSKCDGCAGCSIKDYKSMRPLKRGC